MGHPVYDYCANQPSNLLLLAIMPIKLSDLLLQLLSLFGLLVKKKKESANQFFVHFVQFQSSNSLQLLLDILNVSVSKLEVTKTISIIKINGL